MAPRPTTPIVFVKYYEKGSTDISADQIAAALGARGWPARSLPVRELGALRDGVAIFIKTSRLDHLLAAKARGNRLVLDVHDTVVFKRHIKNRWLYDALIFKNRRQLADFGRPARLDRIIYHQWDARYRPNRAPADRLSICFLGEPRSFALWGQIPGVECIASGDWFAQAPRFNCHLSVRQPGREFLYKPNLKVSTAAVCEAVLITTRDESAVELLGDDYPFYCGTTREEILAAIERTRAAFGKEPWLEALRRLRRVKELTHLDRVLDGYEELIRELVGRRGD
ncbi:MAG: hypothetical protein ACM3OB_06020 [Acidobacteriota bacterium]